MDAYAPGEIQAMCTLVQPRLAVLTAVGPQHLERFRDMARTADALFEVVSSLPDDGVAVMHAGDETVMQLIERASAAGRHVVRYGVAGDAGGPRFDVAASEVRLSGAGARFRWSWPAARLDREVHIPLLGRHQVLNTTAALAVVSLLGHDLDAAVAAARSLAPIEHRLQPLQSSGAVTIIDDSYNANPVGVHNGLDVLAAMDGGRKLLVTPGLVELGHVEDQENRSYGEHAARVCSEVIVMDARPAAALCAGLRAGGLAAQHIHVVRSLDDATALLRQLTRAGDVVLFANDLPDTYLPSKSRPA
jgi:UDP-N-acetylmuramoyl-tripeptide--D-alanyl-D-alanine ligase